MQEHNALNDLKSDSNIYLPSDKGGEFTIIGKKKYIELGELHLENHHIYKHLHRDPTETIKRNFNTLWDSICKRRKIPRKIYLQLSTQTCKTQSFYHLIKTHKTELKIRPIVSGSGGPFDRLGWFLQQIIKPLLNVVSSHLFSTGQLLQSLQQLTQAEMANTTPFSLDIVSMYTNIPVDEGIAIITSYLRENKCNLYGLQIDNIHELLFFILHHNIFTFANQYYHQYSGLAMGSRIAPIIAIVTLDKIEKQTLFSHQFLNIKVFKRYVDDCFVLIDKEENPEHVLQVFNQAHSSIKFEIEKPGDDNSLNILDVNVRISPSGEVSTKFFEKSAKQDIFLHSSSAVPLQTKRATINAEFHRIDNLCSGEVDKAQGKANFKSKLRKNGYTNLNDLFNTTNNHRQNAHRSNNTEMPIYISIPFITDRFQNKLKHILKEVSQPLDIPVRLVNKNSNTLRQQLNKLSYQRPCTKQQCHLNNPTMCYKSYVVYHATCCQCSTRADYVGSSKQYLHERVYQHYTKPAEAIYQHINNNCHSGSPFAYKILARCKNLKEMLFSEAIHIKRLHLSQEHEFQNVLQQK